MGLRGTRVSEEFEYVSDRDPAKLKSSGDGKDKKIVEASIDEARAAGATIFRVGTLRVDLRTKIQDGVMSMTNADGSGTGTGLSMNMNRQHLEAVRFGLKGWENFTAPDPDDDSKDIPIPFLVEVVQREGREYTVPTMDTLAHMQTWLITELGKVVLGSNSVSNGERKN